MKSHSRVHSRHFCDGDPQNGPGMAVGKDLLLLCKKMSQGVVSGLITLSSSAISAYSSFDNTINTVNVSWKKQLGSQDFFVIQLVPQVLISKIDVSPNTICKY